jgi:Ca2+-binding RTX toxin-like protein
MTGGLGNDAFVVDDGGDTVIEAAGEGTDTVFATITYSLTANVENLTLNGSGDIDGTGNVLKNTLVGNSGANVIHGGGDIDTLSGMDGADTLYGDAGNDVLDGGAGDDVLIGGAGYDRLTGGAGADTFSFTNLDIHLFSAGAGLVEKDTIVDLSFAGNDRIDLGAMDANTNLAGDQAFTFATKFTKVAGQAVLSLSGGVTTLQLDVDGDGRADFSIAINGDVTATTANLYTGAGDTNGGWML